MKKGENIKPTHHKKILIANVEQMSNEEVQKTIKSLKQALEEQDVYRLVSLLKKTIPEYKSENSEFGALD